MNNIGSEDFQKNYQLALVFASLKHDGQERYGGEKYINHPIKVAKLVSEYKKPSHPDSLIIAGLLHDTVEDTSIHTYYEIAHIFGFEVASIVMELTNDQDIKNALGKTKYLSLKLKNMTKWALTVKLCDRLDNIIDCKNAPLAFREKYKLETNAIIEYIEMNRDLSPTHQSIIIDIKKRIQELKMYDLNMKTRS